MSATPRSLRATTLAAAICVALGGVSVRIVQAAEPPAEQRQTYAFNIPAGSLEQALVAFSTTSGITVSFTPDAVAGKQMQGLVGTFSADTALSRLLAGTGLSARALANGSYSLHPEQAHALAPVSVSGEASSDTTEGSGSYTTRSSRAATGLNLSLRETPQSVTVITRQRMDDQALDTLDDVVTQTPGVSVWAGSAGAIGTTGNIRSRGYTIENYLVDGVAVPDTYWGGWSLTEVQSLDTAIYDSVTIVRGATGLLSGAGDPSASIELTRKRPTDHFQASVSQSAGRWDQYRTVGDVSGPLNATRTVRGRLVAAYDEGGTWLDRYQGDKTVAYGVLEADLSERTLLRLALEHSRQKADSIGIYGSFGLLFSDGRGPTPFSRGSNATTDWSYHDNERTTVSATLEHHFNDDWRGTLNYSHSDTDNDRKFGWVGMGDVEPDGTNQLWLANQIYESRVDAFDARLNGAYTFWGRQHDVVLGFSASDSDVNQPRYILERGSGVAPVLDWNGEGVPEPDWSTFADNPRTTRIEETGAYLATRLRVTDDLSFIVGGRLSDWETRAKDKSTGAVTDDRKESGVFTPYAGIVYDLTDRVSAYASYTEIFNPQNYRDVNDNTLDPEEGTNKELGLKGEWFNGRLNASIAHFWSGKDNLAVADGNNLTPGGNQAYIAADDTEGRGWDLEISGDLAPGWQLQAGYTHTVIEDSDGERLSTQYEPKDQFKLFTFWAPASLNRLTVGGGVRWQSEIYVPTNREAYTQKSYALVDLMARYAVNEHLSLALNLNNAFDKEYRIQPDRHNYGAPRNLYATLKYQF